MVTVVEELLVFLTHDELRRQSIAQNKGVIVKLMVPMTTDSGVLFSLSTLVKTQL